MLNGGVTQVVETLPECFGPSLNLKKKKKKKKKKSFSNLLYVLKSHCSHMKVKKRNSPGPGVSLN
jgi:hypothetical protein